MTGPLPQREGPPAAQTGGASSGAPRVLDRLVGDIRGRAAAVVLGSLACQMGLGFGYSFGALSPEIVESFGWSRAAWSSARAPQLWAIALASPLVGAATARFGARRVLLASTALLGACYVGVSGVGALWQVTAWIVVLGVAVAGIGDIAAGAMVTQWLHRARGLGLGIVYAGSNLGGWAAAQLIGVSLAFGGWRTGFLTLGGFALVVMLPLGWLTLRDRGEVVSGAPEDAGEDGGAADLDTAAAMRTPSFWILALGLLAFWLYFLAMIDHLVLFLTDVGVADARGWFGLAIGLGVVSKVGFGVLADHLHARASVLFDYGLLAASAVVLLLLPQPALLWVFVVSYGFSAAARDVVTPLIVTWCFGARHMAGIYGMLMLTLLPGGTLGPIFAGWVHDRTGSYALAFQTLAALNALSFALLFLVRDERARRLSGPRGRAPSAAA